MACRLDDYVVSGEIFNTTNYSVHGWLELRGWNHPLLLQLTGNCSPDLAGWHIRFEASRSPIGVDAGLDDVDDLASQQVGPTGRMTMLRLAGAEEGCVREAPSSNCPARRSSAKMYLYLEWFSQNGRVVLELNDPVVEFVDFQELSVSRGIGHKPDRVSGELDDCCDSLDAIAASDPIEGEADDDLLFADLAEGESVQEEDDPEEDPYRLLPKDLELQFEAEASEIDWALSEDEGKSRAIREMEIMDELIANSPGVVFRELFDGPVKCPLPDNLSDEQVEQALKSLLAELARFGIALEVCEHFTPREAYRLLLEEICPEERAYPELRDTQWVQHYSTSDYCKSCQDEFERELNEHRLRSDDDCGEDAPPWDDPDGDMPF